MHVLLLLANSHAFRLRTHYFNRLLARQYQIRQDFEPGCAAGGQVAAEDTDLAISLAEGLTTFDLEFYLFEVAQALCDLLLGAG